MMPKDFDAWNGQKKKVHARDEQILFHEREIWWCSLGVNVGVETDGKNDNFERPVLVLKKFNKDMVWVVPITSRKGPAKYYYPIKYGNKDRWVILSQLKTISSKRLIRKIEALPESDFEQISLLVRQFLKSETPPLGGESRRPKP